MNRRGFLKGTLGAVAAAVAAPKVVAAEGKAKKVMEQTEFDSLTYEGVEMKYKPVLAITTTFETCCCTSDLVGDLTRWPHVT